MKMFKNMKNIGRGKEVGEKPLATRSPIFNHPYNGHPDRLSLLLHRLRIFGSCSKHITCLLHQLRFHSPAAKCIKKSSQTAKLPPKLI